jgi:predicted nucleotidyltransferase
LGKIYPIDFIVLFGSRVKGKLKKSSDIDIGICLRDRISLRKERCLMEEIIHIFKSDQIDIVILNRASPLLLFEIVKNNKLLYERSRGGFLNFKLISMKRYWEYSKFRKFRENYLFLKAKRLQLV